MTRVYFIRHAHTDAIGKLLTGRAPGLHLNQEGRVAAGKLAHHLRDVVFSAIYHSPMERTHQTTELLNLNGPRQVSEELNEIDFGEWTGLSFEQLDQVGAWKTWTSKRDEARAPGGESLREVQQRAVKFVDQIYSQHPDSSVALITHGDVIRAALCHYLCMPLECMEQIEISPASYTLVQLALNSSRVLHLNVVAV